MTPSLDPEAGAPTAPSRALLRERRLFRRFPSGLGAQLSFDGRRLGCRICDISLGGAGLEPALPEALGRRVRLASPGFPFAHPLEGRVVGTSRYGTHMAFDLDERTEAALIDYLVSHHGTN